MCIYEWCCVRLPRILVAEATCTTFMLRDLVGGNSATILYFISRLVLFQVFSQGIKLGKEMVP